MIGHTVILVGLLSASASAACGGTTCEACLADSTCGWTGSGCTSNGFLGLGCANLLCGDPYHCAGTPPAYDESFVRNQLWRLHGAHAGGLTTDNPSFTGCYKAADPEATFAGRVTVTCGFPLPTDTCTTDVFILPTYNAIVAATLGANGLSQTLQVALQFGLPIGSPTGVLNYWANAYNALWTGGVQTLLQGLLTDSQYATYNFVSTGHSIGATVAVQMAKAVSDAGWRDATTIQTITFGQPRIGNTAFLNALYAAAPKHLRVINQNDLITTLPAQIPTLVEHTKFPVRYANGMSSAYLGTATICNTNENSNCAANPLLALQGDYHNTYFGIPAYADWQATNCSYVGI